MSTLVIVKEPGKLAYVTHVLSKLSDAVSISGPTYIDLNQTNVYHYSLRLERQLDRCSFEDGQLRILENEPRVFKSVAELAAEDLAIQQARAAITPESSGASELACRIVNRVMELDGMRLITEANYSSDYTLPMFKAMIAQVVDGELNYKPE